MFYSPQLHPYMILFTTQSRFIILPRTLPSAKPFYDTHSQNMTSTYTANPSAYKNDINFTRILPFLAGYVYKPLLHCDCGLLASNNVP